MGIREALLKFGLGSLKGVDEQSLKKLYRLKVREVHPDVKGTGNEKEFREVKTAYTLLLNNLGNVVNEEVYRSTSSKEEVNRVSFEELLKCYRNKDNKFASGVWAVIFNLFVEINGDRYEFQKVERKNLTDEYKLSIYVPCKFGDEVKIRIVDQERVLKLNGNSVSTVINFNYLAKVTVYFFADNEE